MKQKTVLSVLLLYVLSTAASYGVFNLTQAPLTQNPSEGVSEGSVNPTDLIQIGPNEPRTEACPLNGKLYTVKEREAWEKRRPLAVIVENSPDARPQSGIIRSDVMYEAVAEGGVTRFMPVFLCDAQRSDVSVAPVRSVRTYFIDWASEYGETPLFGHVLGANCSADKLPGGGTGPCKTDPRAQALEQLAKFGWRHSRGNDLDQSALGAPIYVRNEGRLFALKGVNVETEHSVVGRTELLWKEGERRGWSNLDPEGEDWQDNFREWKFKEEAQAGERGTIASISHDFWTGYKQFDVRWEYNPETNEYKRLTGGEPHNDLETGNQLTAKNVVILFTKEQDSVDELKHILYTTIGTGKALIFQDGKQIEGTWKKESRVGRTSFATKQGTEVSFNPGRVWISIVGLNTQVATQ